MKYRKKPVVIDALQWTGKNHRAMFDFLTENTFDEVAMKAYHDNFYIDHSKVEGGLIIRTLEGEHIASIGDFIIRGVKVEYYPCKPDVFEQTYEKVEEGGTPTFPFWGDVPTRIPITSNDTVPYYTICQCNPANGGSGVCGCTMGQTMVPNPGVSVFATNVVNKSTSDSTITSNGNN